MDKEIRKFDETEIEEYKFHQDKNPILTNVIGINKIVVSNKIPFSNKDFKDLIGYKDAEKIRPLCIFCSEMIKYKRNFDKYRHIYFIIKEEKEKKKIQKKFHSELIYSKNYLTTEKKSTQKKAFNVFMHQ